MGWKRIKLLMLAPYMEYKSWRNPTLLLQVGLIPSQQGWERRRQPLEEGLAQLGWWVKIPTH